MSLPGTNGEVSEIIARLMTMPRQNTDAAHTAQVWLSVLHGQPLASIFYAFNQFIRDPKREFCPTSGQFLAVVEEHAARIRLKVKTLTEAISNQQAIGGTQ